MRPRVAPGPLRGTSGMAAHTGRYLLRTMTMKWETPTAVDFRFGMEITMYVSNR